MTHAVITANRLRDGVVVWRSHADDWVEPFGEAAVFADGAVDAALEAASADIGRRLVVGVYKVEVTLRDGHAEPDSVRETIRARGPSVRLDLGIQAAVEAG